MTNACLSLIVSDETKVSYPSRRFKQELERCYSDGDLLKYARKLKRGDMDAARELVQDAAVTALRFAEKFKPGTNLVGWLKTIMFRTHLNSRKSKSGNMHVYCDPSDIKSPLLTTINADGQPGNQEANLIADEMSKALNKVKLGNPRHYDLFLTFTQSDMSYSDFSKVRGMKPGTLKSIVSRVRADIARELGHV